MKKFIRCLTAKYIAYKAAMSVSLNTDEIGFDEVVGMLRAHEMELDGGKKGKNIALTSQVSAEDGAEDNDPMSLLVRRFYKVLRRSEMGQKIGSTSRRIPDIERHTSETEKGEKKVEGYRMFRLQRYWTHSA